MYLLPDCPVTIIFVSLPLLPDAGVMYIAWEPGSASMVNNPSLPTTTSAIFSPAGNVTNVAIPARVFNGNTVPVLHARFA